MTIKQKTKHFSIDTYISEFFFNKSKALQSILAVSPQKNKKKMSNTPLTNF